MKKRICSLLLAAALMAALLPVGARAAENCNFTNLVVFCRFADEEDFVNDQYADVTVQQIVDNTYNASDYSVADYFRTVSGGKMRMQTLYLLNADGSSITLSKPRGYYAEQDENNPSGYERGKEALRINELMQDWSAAINSALANGAKLVDADGSAHSVSELDQNRDGRIDLITLLYKPTTQSIAVDWSDPLWDYQSVCTAVSVDNLTSYNYVQITTNFENSNGPTLYTDPSGRKLLNIQAKICHETTHALGLKDLYQGSEGSSKVGFMSIMGRHTSPVGQFPSAKEREALGWLGDQIQPLNGDGSYTLSEASNATNTVAYKKDLSTGKTLYLEYRRFDEKGNKYDAQGQTNKVKSGLICYLAATDRPIPTASDLEVVSYGQYATMTDCAVGLNETLQDKLYSDHKWITITVTAMTDSTLTFSVSGLTENAPETPETKPEPKPAHSLTEFAKSEVTVTYGDENVGQTVESATGTVQYSSSNAAVATVESDGGVRTLGVGKTTITARVAENDSYGEATRSYTLHVSPKALRLNGLQAEGRKYKAGDRSVKITGELDGILRNDEVFCTFCGQMDDDTAGENKKVTITANLSGKDAGKYEIGRIPHLTVTISAPDQGEDGGGNGGSNGGAEGGQGGSAGGGGGGGGGMAAARYPITLKKPQNGKVTLSAKSAEEGEVIFVRCVAKEGYARAEVKVVDADGAAVTITETEEGFTFLMPEGKVTVEVTFEEMKEEPEEKTEEKPIAEETEAPTFSDVKEEDYFAPAVAWAVKRGITDGVGQDRFAPERVCTRGEIVTLLWRYAGCPEMPNGADMAFEDVAVDSYYAKAVAWAVAQGITNGVTANAFQPDAPCTRAQVVTLLHRAAGRPDRGEGENFADVKSGDYFRDAVAWAAARGITAGVGNDRFAPEMVCTRAQIVTFLFRGEESGQKGD